MDNEAARKTIDELTVKLKEYKKNLDSTQEIRNHFEEEIEKRIKDKIQDYEDQLNKKEENHRAEIALLNEDSENTLNQLKKIFADEKKRLEDKLNTQKQKYDEKTNNIINEYEEKLKEQETQNKTELDNLQYAYEELEAKYNALSLDAQHQISLLTERLLTQDSIMNGDKENLLKLAKAHSEDLEKKILQFNKDRKELTEKIDLLNKEKNKIMQDLNKKEEIIEKLNTTIKEKEKELEDSKKEYDTAIDRIINKFEQYKQKQQDLINEFNIKKMEYQRENDLLKQQIDYLNRKLQEQILFCEENDKSHEDNISELKMELEETFTNKINEIINDKKELYDQLKESENTIKLLNNKINELSIQYEHKIDEQKSNFQNNYEDYENQIKKINYEMDKMQRSSYDQTMRINQLLEEKTFMQNELFEFKEINQNQMKEIEELEKKIFNLEKEKNDLIQEKENLIQEMNHIDSRIKSKGPKTTDISNKFQNIGQSSMSMIRTNMGLESDKKKTQNNYNSESERKSGTNYSFYKAVKISGNRNNINSSEKKERGIKSEIINNNK